MVRWKWVGPRNVLRPPNPALYMGEMNFDKMIYTSFEITVRFLNCLNNKSIALIKTTLFSFCSCFPVSLLQFYFLFYFATSLTPSKQTFLSYLVQTSPFVVVVVIVKLLTFLFAVFCFIHWTCVQWEFHGGVSDLQLMNVFWFLEPTWVFLQKHKWESHTSQWQKKYHGKNYFNKE